MILAIFRRNEKPRESMGKDAVIDRMYRIGVQRQNGNRVIRYMRRNQPNEGEDS